MRSIKATLIIVLVAFMASMQMNAQSNKTSRKSSETETAEFCSVIDEAALKFPLAYLGGETGINQFKQNLLKVFAQYEKSKEKLTPKSREALVSSYSAMAESFIFCTLPLSGINPNTPSGQQHLKAEVRKQKAK